MQNITVMATLIFDFNRALHALLYVANRVERRDIHKLFKILYFADMEHLYKYGRAITGDRYIAMKYGPVPSSIYDMVKIVRGTSIYKMDELKAFFRIEDAILTPLRDADIDYLSVTDIEELNASIAKYMSWSFASMTSKSHGSAWQSAWDNPERDEIYVEDILRECNADEEYIAYIVENILAQREMA